MADSVVARLSIASPVGDLTITERNGAIVALDWGAATATDRSDLLLTAAQQLDAYFYCELRAFDLPLAQPPRRQQAVWREMLAIRAAARPAMASSQHASTPRARRRRPAAATRSRSSSRPPGAGGHGRMGGYSGRGGIVTALPARARGARLPPETAELPLDLPFARK
jgi:methylated-DNA-[protein]-cysteine S-methyltransferase